MKEYAYEVWACSEYLEPHFRYLGVMVADDAKHALFLANESLPKDDTECCKWFIKDIRIIQ